MKNCESYLVFVKGASSSQVSMFHEAIDGLVEENSLATGPQR